MDQTQGLVVMTIVAAIGVVAALVILRGRDRASKPPLESPFAASSEGETLCPNCGMGNLSTDDQCVSCGSRLPRSTA